jgi:hypothetical protein
MFHQYPVTHVIQNSVVQFGLLAIKSVEVPMGERRGVIIRYTGTLNLRNAIMCNIMYRLSPAAGVCLCRGGGGVDPTNDGDVLDPVILESPLESPHNDLHTVMLESPLEPEIIFRDLNDSDPTLTDRIIMEDDSHFEFVNAGDGEKKNSKSN